MWSLLYVGPNRSNHEQAIYILGPEMDGFERLAAWSFWHTIFATRSSSAHSNYTIYRMKTKTPNKAVEPTTIHVTNRAPSSTLRAMYGRGSL